MTGLTVETAILHQTHRGDWPRYLLDELEVGAYAAKVWNWTAHYCPPEQYARIRREQQARAARPTPAPMGQLDLFTETPS